MEDIFLDLSNKLDPAKVELFSLLNSLFKREKISYFIIGAFARDLIMEHGFNIQSSRATLDIDMAILIQNWQQFYRLKENLLRTQLFRNEEKILHRFYSKLYGFIDIVPFGEVEVDAKLKWPPDYSTIMNALGFKDVYRHVLHLKISKNIIIPVVSLAGFVLLKLFAWHDRGFMNKDAKDIAFVVFNYLKTGNHQTLFDEHADLLTDKFDYDIASAHILGRDIGRMLSVKCYQHIISVIDNELIDGSDYKLISTLARSDVFEDKSFEYAKNILKALKTGIMDYQKNFSPL